MGFLRFRVFKGVYILLVDFRIMWPNFVSSLIRPRRFQKSNWFCSKPIGSKVTVWSSNFCRARFFTEFRLRYETSLLISVWFSCKSLHNCISIIKFLFFCTIFIIFEWERIGCSSRAISPAALFDYRCWSSFRDQGTILMVHWPMKNVNIGFQPLFISFKSKTLKQRKNEIFSRKDG